MGAETSLLVKISADLGNFERATQRAVSKLQGMASNLTSLGTTLSLGITAPLTAVAGISLKAAGDMDALRRGMDTVSGSAAATAKQLADLRDVAKLPGLGFPEAVQGSIRLQSVGFSAKESSRILREFGNAIASAGGSKSDLQGVIVQLGQMANSSKVLSQDLRPIIQQVPQVAAVLRKEFGTIDTEVIQKMGISTKQMIETMLNGLGLLSRVSGGFRNDLENLQDSIKRAFASVGDALLPMAQRVINGVIVPMIAQVEDLANSFKALQPGTQDAIIGIGAFAASLPLAAVAIGTTITTALQMYKAFVQLKNLALETTLVQSMQAFSVALTTGVVPALTATELALGPIGWAALAVGAAFAAWKLGPAVADLAGIQSTRLADFAKYVEEIGSNSQAAVPKVNDLHRSLVAKFASQDGSFIQQVRQDIRDAIASINGFEDWLLNDQKKKGDGAREYLGKVINGMTAAAAASADLIDGKAFEGMQRKASGLAVVTETAAQKFDKLTKAAKDSLEAVERLYNNGKASIAQLTQAQATADAAIDKSDPGRVITRNKKAAEEMADAMKAAWASIVAPENLKNFLDQGRVAIEALQGDVLGMMATFDAGWSHTSVLLDGMVAAFKKRISDLNADFATVGVNHEKTADRVVAAYERIKASGMATPFEILRAEKAALEATIEEHEAAGDILQAEARQRVADIEKVLNTSKDIAKATKDAETVVQKAQRQISLVLNDVARGIADNIVHWKGLESAITGVAQNIGKALIRSAIEHQLSRISGLLTDMIGKGGTLGKVLGAIFGGGTSAASTAATSAPSVIKNATDAASSGAGAVGGVGSTASKAVGASATAIVGAVAGVVSAISGVIGNFQMHGMNKSLDLIVNHTLRTANQLIEGLQPQINAYLPFLQSIHERLQTVVDRGINITNMGGSSASVQASGSGQPIVINFYGITDTNKITNEITRTLKLQGAFQ